jgi:hypothetical protein
MQANAWSKQWDAWSVRRQRLAQALEREGCVEVEGELFTDWIWRCKWCGISVYVEIPREWPRPRGPRQPTPLIYWLAESEIPSCWFHLLSSEKTIEGRRVRALCVYVPPDFPPSALRQNFYDRLCETCGKCGCR